MSPLRFRISSLLAGAMVALACTEPNKAPGSVRVTYSTKVGDELPFMWVFTIDGEHVRAVNSSAAGSTQIDSLSAGSHRLFVAGLPTACSTGQDDRTIDIPAGDTLRLALAVLCARTTGDLTVTVNTIGSERDPNGYTVLLDGSPSGFMPPVSGFPLSFAKLPPGTHTISLTDVASNCTVANGPTFPAIVTVDKLTTVAITVSCVAVSGTLRVTTTTTGGADVDPSGYVLTLGTNPPIAIASNAVRSYTVIGGTHTATLSDIEPNCTATSTTASVTVPVGGSTDVAFTVSCGAYPATTAGANFVDPANDTLPNPSNATTNSHDFVGLSTSYGPGFMTVTLKFARAPGGDPLLSYIDFDTDENANTGVAPVMNSLGGAVSQGVEARAVFQLSATPMAILETETTFGPIRIIAGGDSVRLIIPNERLVDDGNVTISAIVGPNDRPTDFMPNGSAALVSHRPAGGVALDPAAIQQSRQTVGTRRALRLHERAWKRPPDRE